MQRCAILAALSAGFSIVAVVLASERNAVGAEEKKEEEDGGAQACDQLPHRALPADMLGPRTSPGRKCIARAMPKREGS